MQISVSCHSHNKGKKTTHLLPETIKQIHKSQDKLNQINGSEADAAKQKFCPRSGENKGFSVVLRFNMNLRGMTMLILKT
jgi:hypothetical protein